MIQDIITFYENHGAYYASICIVILTILIPLWYGISRAVRIELLSEMVEIHHRLQKLIDSNPAKYKHYKSGIDKLVKITRLYKEFQQSLNFAVIFEILSAKPSNSETAKSIQHCQKDKEISAIIHNMSDNIAVTMFFATPWIPIMTLLAIAAILLVTILAKITRRSIRAFDWVKNAVGVKALMIDFESPRMPLNNNSLPV